LIAYVVKADDSVATQPVHLADTQNGKAVVDQGLQPGERVIVDGQYKVRPGIKVVEARQGAAPAPVAQASGKR
jgi:multidrug efflux system membrane fusion protein